MRRLALKPLIGATILTTIDIISKAVGCSPQTGGDALLLKHLYYFPEHRETELMSN